MKFQFTDDGDIHTFLGVEIQRTPDGIQLLQSHRIERMLQAVHFSATQDDKGRNLKCTPVVKPFLIRDTNRAPMSLPWNYRSVIGMLNYLLGLTRPDASFAVQQVDRFCVEPKRSHDKAAIRIARFPQISSHFVTFYKVDKKRIRSAC